MKEKTRDQEPCNKTKIFTRTWVIAQAKMKLNLRKELLRKLLPACWAGSRVGAYDYWVLDRCSICSKFTKIFSECYYNFFVCGRTIQCLLNRVVVGVDCRFPSICSVIFHVFRAINEGSTEICIMYVKNSIYVSHIFFYWIGYSWGNSPQMAAQWLTLTVIVTHPVRISFKML